MFLCVGPNCWGRGLTTEEAVRNAKANRPSFHTGLQLSYNIGSSGFCGSTLVRKLNAYDYAGACLAIRQWDKFRGQPLRGLTLRREREYQQCITP